MTNNIREQTTPEFEVLLCTARTAMTDAAREQLHVLLAEEIEWGHLLFLARYHRVTELVYQSLRREAPHVVRGEVENYLRSIAHRTVAYNMVLAGELARLNRLFEENGLLFIAFKGPVLAQTAYKNLGLRSSVDLDLLVRPERFDRVEQLLQEEDYEPAGRIRDLSPLQKRAYLHLARQVSYINRKRMTGLDVHTAVMPPGYLYAYEFDRLLERARTVRISGADIRGFGAEDMVHLLCFHGVKNRWDQLKYVCDVAEFVGAHPDLDWDVVMKRARSTRGERILYHGLHVAQTLFDVPLPAPVRAQIKRAGYTRTLSELTVTNLLNSHQEILGGRQRFRFHLMIQDDVVNRARYVLYSLMRHVGGVIDI